MRVRRSASSELIAQLQLAVDEARAESQAARKEAAAAIACLAERLERLDSLERLKSSELPEAPSDIDVTVDDSEPKVSADDMDLVPSDTINMVLVLTCRFAGISSGAPARNVLLRRR